MTRMRSALWTSRAAAAMAASALVVAVCGVTPADAVKAVKRALNADAVDGFSASKKPKPGQLLALDSKARFPASVVPGTGRGTQGPPGPAGAPGAAGPPGAAGSPGLTEAYINRNDDPRDLPRRPGMVAAEVRVPAGAYVLDFTARAYSQPTENLTFVHCQLTTNGLDIVETAAHVGSELASADPTETRRFGNREAVLAASEAITLSQPSAVRVLCSEDADTNVKVLMARLRAVRVTSVIEQ